VDRFSSLPVKSAIVYASFSGCGDVDNSKAVEDLSAAYVPYETYTHMPDLSRVLEGIKYE